MEIKNIASNMTVVSFGDGDELLISYKTPVAGKISGVMVRTNKFWSQTTSRHINKYFNSEWGVDPKVFPIEEYDQSLFDKRLSHSEYPTTVDAIKKIINN
jgi:hypothetical protein